MWLFCENAISQEGQQRHEQFIAKHREEIAGVLSGFDRLIYRGTRRSISYPEGMMGYLWPRICERPVGARRGSVGNCGSSGAQNNPQGLRHLSLLADGDRAESRRSLTDGLTVRELIPEAA
jgi:hypothetical protein